VSDVVVTNLYVGTIYVVSAASRQQLRLGVGGIHLQSFCCYLMADIGNSMTNCTGWMCHRVTSSTAS